MGKLSISYTKNFQKPFDLMIRNGFFEVCRNFFEEVQGLKLCYCQSDEVSLLITDYDSLVSQPWFNKNIQKITSITASIATAAFNSSIKRQIRESILNFKCDSAFFDSRVFVLPKEETCNYFIWRQKDAIRNSVSALAQKYFSSKQLHKKNIKQMKEMLLTEKKISWDDCLNWQKFGFCVSRKTIQNGDKSITRHAIIEDLNIPVFSENRKYVNDFVFLEPEIENDPS